MWYALLSFDVHLFLKKCLICDFHCCNNDFSNGQGCEDSSTKKESREKELEAYEGQLADLRYEVNETLDHALKNMYGSFDQATNYLEALRLGVQVFRS